jgi:hypothetical protein
MTAPDRNTTAMNVVAIKRVRRENRDLGHKVGRFQQLFMAAGGPGS